MAKKHMQRGVEVEPQGTETQGSGDTNRFVGDKEISEIWKHRESGGKCGAETGHRTMTKNKEIQGNRTEARRVGDGPARRAVCLWVSVCMSVCPREGP